MSNREFTGGMDPLSILKKAISAVPSLKYAFGVVGIVAAIVIVKSFQIDYQTAVTGTVIMFVLMVILVIFSKVARFSQGELRLPALVLTWFALILVISTACMLFTSIFLNWPKGFQEVLRTLASVNSNATKPTIIIQISKETLLEAARQAQLVADTDNNKKSDAAIQADSLRRAAQDIGKPIKLVGGPENHIPVWLTVAYKELGETEIEGQANNPRIVEYLKSVSSDLASRGDEMYWNGAFVNWVFLKSGIKPKGSAMARAWLSWGGELAAPRLGALAIFRHEYPIGTGSLCFYIGETKEDILCLGGNFRNSVQITALPKKFLLGYRWPNDTQ